MNRQIEILAPAGSYESMVAAMNAGCDAVYMGGSMFGARAYADNPDEDTLIKAIREAHLRNKKLYLTVNTLIKEEERLNLLYNYLEKYYLAGLDAVIVQDVGVMHFIHRHFPKLDIHASTQTTITMADGANLLKSMGVSRLVTARELSYMEIKHIRENTDLEIETFVHGALCYCYSGQCLMSSMIGGRSGNRGRCAQPCRLPYQFFSEGGKISSDKEPYLLSPKDINTVAHIPDLIEAGVDSFKIEGRMKSPEYAAGVSSIYRKYVDLYLAEGKEKFNEYLMGDDYKKDMLNLMDLYNRGGFSQGYGKTYHGKSMMSMVRPNHSGVVVAEVVDIEKGSAKIKLLEDINAQDILEFRNNENIPVYEFTVKDKSYKDSILKIKVGSIPYKHYKNTNTKSNRDRRGSLDIKKGYLLYRTRNNMLLDSIRENYIKKNTKQDIIGHLKAKQGKSLQFSLTYNNITVTVYHNLVEAALKQPMTREKIRSSIDKLGPTLFNFKELIIEADSNIFIPVAWLNEIRREAIDMLEKAIISAYERTEKDLATSDTYEENQQKNTDDLKIRVGIHTEEQFKLAVKYPEISALYGDYESFSLQQLIKMSEVSSNKGKEFYILLPHICRLSTYEKLYKDINILMEHDTITGFIIKNFEEVALILNLYKNTRHKKKVMLNHNMYIFNKESKTFWNKLGINEFCAPIELNQKELKGLGLYDMELMVYGYLPVMVSTQCLYASTKGCNKCKPGIFRMDYLVDRIGKKFYVKTNCNSCYNIIYNGQCLSLLRQAEKIMELKPKGIRLDFTYEAPEEMERVISAYIDVFLYGKKAVVEFDNITGGHFKRGVQ